MVIIWKLFLIHWMAPPPHAPYPGCDHSDCYWSPNVLWFFKLLLECYHNFHTNCMDTVLTPHSPVWKNNLKIISYPPKQHILGPGCDHSDCYWSPNVPFVFPRTPNAKYQINIGEQSIYQENSLHCFTKDFYNSSEKLKDKFICQFWQIHFDHQ